MEGVVIDTVGEFVGAEAVALVVDLRVAFTGVGLVILFLIDLFAPAVVDGKDVGHQRVHVLDSENVVLSIAVKKARFPFLNSATTSVR